MSERIAPVSPPYDARIAEDFAKLMPEGMEPLALFRMLARNPRVLGRVRRGGLLDPGSIPLRQRELVILRTTARAAAEYEWGVHAAFFGAAAGLDARQLYATVWLAPEAECWTAEEALLLRVCDELHRTARVDDATWTALRASFEEEQLVEILVLAGLYRMIAYACNGATVPLEPGAPRLPPFAREPDEGARHHGSCLCKSVQYELTGDLGDVSYCHCQSCRKASGSAHSANAPVDRARFRLVSGQDTLQEYESSPGKRRVFCSRCGAPLYVYFTESPDVLRLRLGSLDTPFARPARAHSFVADKAAWDIIEGALPQFAGWAPASVLDRRPWRRDGAHDSQV